MDQQFDAKLSAALLAFNAEAVVYCRGISEILAQEYAIEYVRVLQKRAKGVEAQLPRIPFGLFEPNRNLIRSTLDRMWEKHFRPAVRSQRGSRRPVGQMYEGR